ncbi:hypothetical protein FB451DRAFT_1419292 [Mycena latifolia]|nr:hypothetical protein FB451DRAFT_1419292 [Mycena latifolia]
MVLKLYSDPRSFAGGGGAIVALVLMEKKIPFEYVPIDLATQQNKTLEYATIQPFGQVPAIDEGFILYKSHAICRYLTEKYRDQGTPLLPTGLRERALFEQAASIELANLHPYCARRVQYVFSIQSTNRRQGLRTDANILAHAVAEVSEKLSVYETILGKHRNHPRKTQESTLVDVFHPMYAHIFADDKGINLKAKMGPNVVQYVDISVSSARSW